MELENIFETKKDENKQILNDGEDSLSWLKTVCAFANTDGGIISVGVKDNFDVLGLKKEQVDKQVQLFLRLTKEHINPLPKFDFNYLKTERDTYVLEIKVFKSSNLPVILTFHNIPSIYIRNEGRNSPASSEEIQTLVFSSFPEKYDLFFTNEIYESSSYSLLSKKYKNINKQGLTQKKLFSLKAINESSCVSRGLLLFKDNFHGSDTLIKISKWKGIDKSADSYVLLYEENSNIIKNIDDALEVIKNNISSYEKKLEIGRESLYDYPLRSIFEGLVNAYAHKNYFLSDRPIEIDIFINRIEITSPGRLVNSMNIYNEKNISSIQPTRRNEIISSLLNSIKYMEKEGSGFDKISEDYKLYPEIYKPSITSLDSYFKLILPSINSFGVAINEDIILPITTPFDSSLSIRDKTILGFCYQKPRTLEQIASKINMKVSSYLRKVIIGNLISKDLLKESNVSKATLYFVNKNLVSIMQNFSSN